MKRRTLTIVVGLLLCLSLIGVGFASWVITAGDTNEQTGSITVYEVTDERIEITDVTNLSEKNFVFGAPTTPAEGATKGWLQNATKEVLEIEVTFKVAKKSDDTAVNDAVCSVAFELAEGTSFAVEGEEGKTYAAIANAAPAVTNNGDGTYSFTIALTWGNYWGEGVNPYDYYNSLDCTDDLANEANTKLGKMYTALASAEYKVTITANPAA